MKILFITANRLGDAVLTTGVLAHLTREYPGAEITIACGPFGADLFCAVPGLQRLIVMKKQKWNGHWVDLWRACFGVRWDLIVDLRNSVVSRLLRARRRAVYRKGSGRHKVLDNAAVLGVAPAPDPQIWITDEAERSAEALLPKDRRILALAPAANWPPKQWPLEKFAALARQLTAGDGVLADAAVMIIADKHEREQLAPLLQAIKDPQRIEIIGRDLQVAAACLKRASLFVGNDSGLMHLSAAVGVPTVGLFGPGWPEIYGPWGKRCAVVKTPESREALLSRLENIQARAPNLMRGLEVERVVEAVEKLLRGI